MAQDPFDWSQFMIHVVSSDIGMRRSKNQDSYVMALAADMEEWRERGHLFIVADGMGAHAAGELASKLAVDNVAHIYRKHPEMSPPEGLEKAIRDANQEIHRRGEANLDFHHMGTTCSTMLLLPQGALIGHVGDSRVYRLRRESLSQLTFDHSLVWEMREAGRLGSGHDEASVPKNVITRSLGPQEVVKVDLEGPFPIETGDTFLLCSDGLTGRVEDVEIGAVLAGLEPPEAATLLINLANLRGGPDNITVVIAKIVSNEFASHVSHTEPLTLGSAKQLAPPLHVAWWVALGVSGLLAGAMIATDGPRWAWLPLIVSCGILLAIVVQKFNLFGPELVRLAGGRRLGKGPHRKYGTQSLAVFTSNLLEAFDGGRELASSRGWNSNWDEFDGACQAARRHSDSKQYREALQSLVKASSFLVEIYKENSQFSEHLRPVVT